MMIPKVIHYIWLSDEPLNTVAKKCIASWHKHAPDYEIKRWSMDDFDLPAMPEFVIQAIVHKKWAFACDYLRLYVLYHEGGLYLDADVLMMENIDRLLHHRFVSAVEYYPDLFAQNCTNTNGDGNSTDDFAVGINIQAAVMASEPEHPFVRSCMDYYDVNYFENPDGTINTNVVAPQIYAHIAGRYGFRYVNKEQVLENDMILYSSEIVAPGYHEASDKSALIHLCNGSWRDMTKLEKIRNAITKNQQIRAAKK